MMADSNFIAAEKLCDALLKGLLPHGAELLELYCESLRAQNKRMAPELMLELTELKLPIDPIAAEQLLVSLTDEERGRCFGRSQLLWIRITHAQGKNGELYDAIAEFLLRQYEARIPWVPAFVLEIIEKFFQGDYFLLLKLLAIELQLGEMGQIERRIREIISLCFEKPSIRGVREKFILLSAVLSDASVLGPVPIYQNFCTLMTQGILEKRDYKKLAELVIYFDDFQFKAHVLALLHQLSLSDVCAAYALDLRLTEAYDFVYLDKYHPELKSYFVTGSSEQVEAAQEQVALVDLDLEAPLALTTAEPYLADDLLDEEFGLISALKFQAYDCDELVEISTSLIQSRFFRAARAAAELAMGSAPNARMLLKASYLKLTALLHLRDFRAVLDLSMDSMRLAESQEDILAFLYSQAEAYQHLGDSNRARKIFRKILAIDAGYRLVQEKLEKLA